MRTFGNLNVGDHIWKCNFVTNDIKEYEIIDITESKYSTPRSVQVCFHLSKISNNTHTYFDNNVNEIINVYSDRLYENDRMLMGHNLNIFWCAGYKQMIECFDKYKNKILNELNDTLEHIYTFKRKL